MTRLALLVILAALFSACSDGGGNGDGDRDAGTDAADGTVGDGDVLDSALPEDSDVPDGDEGDGSIEDAGMDANNCPDGSAGDAGTQTVSNVCMRVCGTYLPTCGTVPPDCMTTCATANGSLSPSQLGHVYACTNVTNASECAAAQACVTYAYTCP